MLIFAIDRWEIIYLIAIVTSNNTSYISIKSSIAKSVIKSIRGVIVINHHHDQITNLIALNTVSTKTTKEEEKKRKEITISPTTTKVIII